MIKPVWGTMRMLDHSDDPIFWEKFFTSLHSRGVTCLHSSFEYPSFALLSEVLRRLSRKEIFFSHIVKLAEPSFHEQNFVAERFLSKLDWYKKLLPGNIRAVQWMWRSEGSDITRIENFLKYQNEISKITSIVPTYCFPYSIDFAEKALEIKDLKGLIVYWNKDEIEYKEALQINARLGRGAISLRPFYTHERNIPVDATKALNFCEKIPNLEAIVFTSTSSRHLDESLTFFNDQLS